MRMNIKLRNIMLLTFLSFQASAIGHDKSLDDAKLKLNACYKNILNRLSYTEQLKLKKAQQQWIIFRDLDCAWAYKAVPFHCLLKRTINRTKQLQETMFFDKKGVYSSIELDPIRT